MGAVAGVTRRRFIVKRFTKGGRVTAPLFCGVCAFAMLCVHG